MARSYRLNKFHHQTWLHQKVGELPWKALPNKNFIMGNGDIPERRTPMWFPQVVWNHQAQPSTSHSQWNVGKEGKMGRLARIYRYHDFWKKKKHIWTKITLFFQECRICCCVGCFALTTSGIFNHRNMESPKISKELQILATRKQNLSFCRKFCEKVLQTSSSDS